MRDLMMAMMTRSLEEVDRFGSRTNSVITVLDIGVDICSRTRGRLDMNTGSQLLDTGTNNSQLHTVSDRSCHRTSTSRCRMLPGWPWHRTVSLDRPAHMERECR